MLQAIVKHTVGCPLSHECHAHSAVTKPVPGQLFGRGTPAHFLYVVPTRSQDSLSAPFSGLPTVHAHIPVNQRGTTTLNDTEYIHTEQQARQQGVVPNQSA